MAYTYLIGWSKHNKFYYGARWAKNCNPADLWKTYFTSSIHVKKYREQFGEPDIIQIRKIFTDIEKCRTHEQTILRRLKVITNTKWLNKNINGRFLPTGPQTEEHKKARSLALMGHAPTFTGKHTPDSIDKIRRSQKGVPKSESHKKSMKLRPQNAIITCPHCDKSGDYRNMKRWHYDNCKLLGKERKKYSCPHCSEVGVLPNIMYYHFDNCVLNPKVKNNICQTI